MPDAVVTPGPCRPPREPYCRARVAAPPHREPGADRARRARARPRAQRAHRRDRRRQDDAGPGHRADRGRPAGGGDGRPPRRRVVRRGRVRGARGVLRRRLAGGGRRAAPGGRGDAGRRPPALARRPQPRAGLGPVAAPAPTCRRSASACSRSRPSTRRGGSPAPATRSTCWTTTPTSGRRRPRRWPTAWSGLRACRAALERQREATRDAERRRSELEGLVEAVDALAPEPGERDRLSAERERLRHLDELRAAAGDAARAAQRPTTATARSCWPAARRSWWAASRRSSPGWRPRPPSCATSASGCRRRRSSCVATSTSSRPTRPGWTGSRTRLAAFSELERRHGRRSTASSSWRTERGPRSSSSTATASGWPSCEAEVERPRIAGPRPPRPSCRRARRRGAAAVRARTSRRGAGRPGHGGREARGRAGAGRHGQPGRPTRCGCCSPPTRACPPRRWPRRASGGELSRIALAIRVAARSGGGPATLLLDEVDAGVGGRTANAVGEKLKGWPPAPSCSASPTCRRSPRRPTPTSASRSCRATRP